MRPYWRKPDYRKIMSNVPLLLVQILFLYPYSYSYNNAMLMTFCGKKSWQRMPFG